MDGETFRVALWRILFGGADGGMQSRAGNESACEHLKNNPGERFKHAPGRRTVKNLPGGDFVGGV